MAEPVSSSAATAAVGAITLLSLLPGVPVNVVIGAFAGAVAFVMASHDLSLGKKAGFFLISFLSGCLSAHMVTGLIASVLPKQIDVNEGVGALLAATLSVKLLLWLIRRADNPPDLFNLKGGGK